MRVRHARIGLASVIAIALAQCVSPTAIELVLTTNVPCASVQQVVVEVGPPGDDSRAASAVTTSCTDGGIGTLVLTPSGGIDDVVGVRAMLGVARPADQCAAPGFSGCIVARRELRYAPHTELVLPIELDQSCLDVPCDPHSTCVDGQCVDAGVGPCVDLTCNVADAGPPDAGVACTPFGPVVVADAITGFKPKPHIVALSNGWAVAYETAAVSSARQLNAVTVDATGNVSPTQRKIGSAQPGLEISAVGTDGTSYGYAQMASATSFFGASVPLVGTGSTASGPAGPIASLSSTGFFWDATAVAYVFLVPTGGGSIAVGSYSTQTNAVELAPLDTNVSPADATLSRSSGVYFASYLDGAGACKIQRCTSLSPPACAPITVSSCSAAQAAEQNGVVLVADRGIGGNGAVSVTSNSATAPLGVMDGNGPLVLPAPPLGFHVIWSSNGALETAVVTSNVKVTQGAPLVTGLAPPIEIDAVADPSGPGYALSYYDDTASKIYFRHLCQ